MNIVLYHGRHVRFERGGKKYAGQVVAMYPGVEKPQRVTVETYFTRQKFDDVKPDECQPAVRAVLTVGTDTRECVQDVDRYWYHVLNLNWRMHASHPHITKVTPIQTGAYEG